MQILPIYAALLILLFVYLSTRAIGVRRKLKIAIGDSGHPQMLRAMRVHSNFAEYVPLALLGIYWVEVLNAPPILVHALGASLLIGRLLHAFGVSQTTERMTYRVSGMILTLTVLIVCAAYLLIHRVFL